MDKIQTNYAEWKIPEERVLTLWFYSYKIIHSDKKQISKCMVKELEEGKKSHQMLLWNFQKGRKNNSR